MDTIMVDEVEAGKLLGLSGRTLYQLRIDGELPFVAIGKAIRYRVDSLKAWAKRKEQRVERRIKAGERK